MAEEKTHPDAPEYVRGRGLVVDAFVREILNCRQPGESVRAYIMRTRPLGGAEYADRWAADVEAKLAQQAAAPPSEESGLPEWAS